jgi:membrane protein
VESQLRVPGEVTRKLSDKLIRAGLVSLAGRNGDRLVPACSLEMITVGRVLDVIRADEDRVVDRLPYSIPRTLLNQKAGDRSATFAQLLRDELASEELRP